MERLMEQSEAPDLTGRCLARTRRGTLCLRWPSKGRKRCRLHGGAPGSGAPRGERHGRYKNGLWTIETRERQRQEYLAANPWIGALRTIQELLAYADELKSNER
jgi:hypothetical protein